MPNKLRNFSLPELRNTSDANEAKTLEELDSKQNFLINESEYILSCLESSATGLWDWDIESGEASFSQQWTAMLGYKEGEFEQSSDAWRKSLHPHDIHRVEETLSAHMSGRSKSYSSEFRMLCNDGNYKWILARGKIVSWDSEGKPRRMVGTHTDISDLKHAQLKLSRAGDQLRYMLESSPAAVRIASHKTQKVLFANARYSILINTDNESTIGQTPRDYYLNKSQYDGILAELTRSKCVNNKLVRLKVPEQGIKSVLASYLDISYEDEKCMMAWFMDVSQLVQAEQSVRLHASVFENSREGIFITDPDNKIISVNNSFTVITEYSETEVLGSEPTFLNSGRQSLSFYENIWRHVELESYWKGEIWNRRKSGEVYPEQLTISRVSDSQGCLLHYMGIFTDISESKRHEEVLKSMAHYDSLTRLPNRILLVDRMEQALESCRRSKLILAICLIDLDEFKPINDKYGHMFGDKLLVKIARKLESSVRANDTVSRLGGDEFILLLNGLEDMQELDRLLTRLLRATQQTFEIENSIVSVSSSIGVTLFPSDRSDPDTLIRHADMAMYEAKQAGKNRYHLFDIKLERERHDRQVELEGLTQALNNNEFVLHYQPKVDLSNQKVIGVEALVRWQHPSKGLLFPNEFLPLIESHPLMLELGAWVLSESLAQLFAWQKNGISISMSVNVSSLQLQDVHFPKIIEDSLSDYPEIAGNKLELEILETSLLQTERVSVVVEEISSKLGVRFALDDFGTGYSSLTYLKEIPASTIKIDQSFVRDMLMDSSDRAIVEGIIGLAKTFKREVIAEGVETPEQAIELMRMGCEVVQGFGISQALPPEAFEKWLMEYNLPS